MSRIRVLVVDDSVVVRKVVTDALALAPEVEVVGTAPNGRIGLAKVAQLRPDVVTMDIEMPDMDGLEALRALRKTHPTLPVIMFSTLTDRGAVATLDALSAGASDYVTKPSNVGEVTEAQARIREQLIPKILALCGRRPGPVVPGSSKLFAPGSSKLLAPGSSKLLAPGSSKLLAPPGAAAAKPKAVTWPARAPAVPLKAMPVFRPATGAAPANVELVAVATSTGGPNALTELFAALPADFPVPIVVVQHMPPVFTRLLAERLAAKSRLRVAEGVEGGRLAPGLVWVAPGDFHMTVGKDATGLFVRLNQQPSENGCRPAADVLFRSVAEVVGAGVLAVVLTGMGQDGFRGCEAIIDRGGRVLCQDEATSVVWGMPGFVARAGLAERVLPLAAVGPEVVRRVRAGRGGSGTFQGRTG